MSTPLAIVNLKTTSRPAATIRYFADKNKVTATYADLDVGVAKGTPKQLEELLLAYHHDSHVQRVCRTAVISVQTPPDASPELLADLDRRLLRAARDFQKFMRIASMLGWVHGNTATRHIHLIFANTNGRRSLDLRPKFLKELQGFAWTIQFASGRGKGKRKALPMYPKAKTLDARVLAIALLDSNGHLRKDRWDHLVETGKVSDFRLRKDGTIISFEFKKRRIRLATLKSFLSLLAGQPPVLGGGENQQSEIMTTIINPAESAPDGLQADLQDSGFTSADVQEILSDIREAQGHLKTTKITRAIPSPITPKPGFSL
jgi:hypothetical protein